MLNREDINFELDDDIDVNYYDDVTSDDVDLTQEKELSYEEALLISETIKYSTKENRTLASNAMILKDYYNITNVNKSKNVKSFDDTDRLQDVIQARYSFDSKDLGNAQRFLTAYKDCFKYVYDKDEFMFYDDKKWVVSENKHLNAMHNIIMNIKKEIAQAKTDLINKTVEQNEVKLLERQFLYSSTDNAVLNAVRVLKNMNVITIHSSDLNKNAYLLNVKNGTFNLKTNTLQEFDRDDLITTICDASYNENAESDVFDKFLNDIFLNRKDLIEYVQKAIASSLVAEVSRDQSFFILYGEKGSNGKSTFLNIIEKILNDYAVSTSNKTWQMNKNNQNASGSNVSPDLVRLFNKRFVVSSELDKHAIFNDNLIKAATGGDLITARDIFKSPFSFNCKFKLFLTSNSLPRVDARDFALMRRVRIIPFDASFSLKDADVNLNDKLYDARDAILKWMIEGYAKYSDNGLKDIPDAMLSVANKCISDNDKIQQFLDETVIMTENKKDTVALQNIFESYKNYCAENNYKSLGRTNFVEELRLKNIIAIKRNVGFIFTNMKFI